MQAALNPAGRISFIRGRDYMMRSEKRGSSGPAHRSPTPGGKPPRKRRRAGFFYKLITILLLLVVWPVGLVLLWRRKLRWGAATKLLTSVVTLAACVVMIGFALTVNTDNARYTAFQDSVNGYLDTAADGVVAASAVVAEKAEIVYERASTFGEALWEHGRSFIADGIDWTLEKTEGPRGQVNKLLGREDVGIPTIPIKAETPAPADESPAPAVRATNAPSVEVTVHAEDETLPVYIPSANPAAADGMPLTEGMLSRAGTLEDKPLPPLNTPEPEPQEVYFEVKPAAEAVVYYNPTGKLYHNVSACRSMKSAASHSFSEVLDEIHTPCDACTPPDKGLLNEEYIVWIDDQNTAHTSDACGAFSGMWNLLAADEALEQGLTACPACKADEYLAALEKGDKVIFEQPTPEPTAEATPKPTEIPTAQPTEAASAAPSATASAKPTEASTAEASATAEAA